MPEPTVQTPIIPDLDAPASPPTRGDRQARGAVLFLLALIAVYAGLLTATGIVVLRTANDRFDMDPMQVGEVYLAMRYHGILAASAAFAALACRRRAAIRPRWARPILAIAALSLMGSCDRIAAVCFPPPSEINSILEPHPVRGWTHRPDAVGTNDGARTRTNALGFRGPPLPRSKSAEDFRILFIGDSVTFGYVLEEEATLSEHARRLLQAQFPRRRISTLNAGVEGYATWQELNLLENEGLRAKPDLVVVQHCLNDITDLVFMKPGQISGASRTFEFSNTSHWSGLLRAATTLQARRRLKAIFEQTVWSGHSGNDRMADGATPFEELFRRPPLPAVEEAWTRSLADLGLIHDVCQKHHLPWVLVLFPFNFQVEAEQPDTLPQDRLRAWADARGVHVLDLLPPLHEAMVREGRGIRQVMLDEVHLTPFGTKIAAERIVQFLVDLGLGTNGGA